MIQISIRQWLHAPLILALIATLFVTTPCSAQFGEAAGIAEAMQPEYFRRDIVLFVDALDLDEGQQMLLETLYEDYLADFDDGRTRMEERMTSLQQELKGAPKEDVLTLVFRPIQDWTGERLELGNQFIANIQLTVLNEEQMHLWPMFEQRLYREKVLREGRFSGESINLFHALRDLARSRRFDERTLMLTVETTLENYSRDLHEALQSRKRAKRSTQIDTMNAIRTQEAARSMPAINALIQARIRIREVNDQYIEMIATSLPEEWGTAFRDVALGRAYPQVYRITPYARILNEARDLEEITEETRFAIEELIQTFAAELSVINEDMMHALQQYEPEKMRDQTLAYIARMNNEAFQKTPDPMRPKLEKRATTGRGYLQLLQALLTPEQFNSISGARRWVTPPRASSNRTKTRGANHKNTQKEKQLSRPGGGGSGLKSPGRRR